MSPSKRNTVPIGAGITDAFYRYQMEAVECEYKRRRNKTAILNMTTIARDINRSPEEVIKYLGHALSSSGSFSSKSGEYLINGSYSQQVFQDKLQEYCEMFVVCGLCSNPETQYKIKRETIFLECAACGGRSEVEGTHKLCKSILMQHKLSKQRSSKKSSGEKKLRKEKKDDKFDAGGHGEGRAGNGENDSKVKRKSKKRTPQVDASTPKAGDYDEEFVNPYFSTKGNPLYVGCFDRIAKASNRDESAALDHAVGKVRAFLINTQNATTGDIVQVVTLAQETARVLFSRERLQIFVKALIKTDSTVESLLGYSEVLIYLMESDPSLEYDLIDLLEEVCRNDREWFPVALMELYESDILQEKTILDWSDQEQPHDRLVSNYVHAALLSASGPLISWLREENTEAD